MEQRQNAKEVEKLSIQSTRSEKEEKHLTCLKNALETFPGYNFLSITGRTKVENTGFRLLSVEIKN